jgi:hypothetical protein
MCQRGGRVRRERRDFTPRADEPPLVSHLMIVIDIQRWIAWADWD